MLKQSRNKMCAFGLFALKVIDATITDRLEAGIKVGQRVYRFLGGSNSLINNHGCYVCADYEGVTAESIRKEIGNVQQHYIGSVIVLSSNGHNMAILVLPSVC